MKTLALILALLSPACCAESVFKLYSNNGHQEWSATAFAIDEHRLLTAAHTFGFTTRKGYGKHFILRDGKLEQVTIVKIDYDKDICVLRDDHAFESHYALAESSKTPCVVRAVGFAGDSREETVIEANWKKSSKWLDTDGPAKSGMSGCPMTDTSGTVLGMLVNGDKHKTHSVPVESLSAFLK